MFIIMLQSKKERKKENFLSLTIKDYKSLSGTIFLRDGFRIFRDFWRKGEKWEFIHLDLAASVSLSLPNLRRSFPTCASITQAKNFLKKSLLIRLLLPVWKFHFKENTIHARYWKYLRVSLFFLKKERKGNPPKTCLKIFPKMI